jgi:hypothetical protein
LEPDAKDVGSYAFVVEPIYVLLFFIRKLSIDIPRPAVHLNSMIVLTQNHRGNTYSEEIPTRGIADSNNLVEYLCGGRD